MLTAGGVIVETLDDESVPLQSMTTTEHSKSPSQTAVTCKNTLKNYATPHWS